MPDPRQPTSFGEHDVVRRIAAGGMGAVFEVRDRRTGVRRAAKTILSSADGRARARFQREGELVARCDRHPGIVKVHSTGETPEGVPYLILDFVEGEDLGRRLERVGRLDPRQAAGIVRDVARALDFVHERGVVHRDVKPGNVILDAAAGGAPRLTDFGVAGADHVERLTRTGAFVGTVAYCAPEQAHGRLTGPLADVFSLGAVLFHTVSGEPPCRGSGLAALSELDAKGPIRDVRSVARDVPAPIAGIIGRALEKDPARRYRTAGELADDLDRFLEGRPVLAGPPPGASRVRSAVLAALAVAVVAGAGAAVVAGRARASRLEALLARDLDGAADGPGVAKRLALLREAGAGDADLAALASRVASNARRESLAAGATSDAIRARQKVLEALGREADVRALDAALVLVLARDLERPGAPGAGEATAALALASAALRCEPELDLVGERGGPGVGLSLVEAARRLAPAEAAAVASAAQALAGRRLARNAQDASGSALAAYARLAAAGAPLRALGPGRPGTEAARDPGILADLERASRLGGEPGARAAALSLDLVASAAERDEANVARLAEAAERRAASPGGEVWREPVHALAALARIERAPDGLGPLVAAEAFARDPERSASLLARLLSRAGAPGAVDRPELVGADLARLREAVAREDVSCWRRPPLPPPGANGDERRAPGALADKIMIAEVERRERYLEQSADIAGSQFHERVEAAFRANAPELDALIARGLAANPDDPYILSVAARPQRGLFSSQPLAILVDRLLLDDAQNLERQFDPMDRMLLASNQHSTMFYPESWSLDGRRGEQAVRDFAQRARHDLFEGGDPAVERALGHGLSRGDVELAWDAATGLKALEELGASDGAVEADRAWLTVRAAKGLESYARLGGPTGLAFRARWRRLAVPGRAGVALAALDLLRLAKALREDALRVRGSDDPPALGGPAAFVGAAEAASLGGDGDVLARELLRLGIALTLERAAISGCQESAGYEARLAYVQGSGANDALERLGFIAGARDLRKLLSWGVEGSREVERAFAIPDDLKARLRGKTWTPPPRWP